MTVYMLGEMNDKGQEMFRGIFESEGELLKAIAPTIGLKIVGNTVTLEVADLSAYRVRQIQTNTIVEGPGIGEIDLADHYVTIQSPDSGKLYSVAIAGGKLVACSCPSFQYQKDVDDCKHLRAVAYAWGKYGLERALGEGFRPLANQQAVVPGGPNIEFSYRPPVGGFVGKPGSWRL